MLLLLLMAMTLATAPAAMGRTPRVKDITATATGRALARSAALHFKGRGIDSEAGSLRIFRLPDRSILATPRQFSAGDIQANSDGSVRVVVTADPEPPAFASAGVTFAATPYWDQRGSNCFTRTQYTNPYGTKTGWMDTCYKINKLVETSDSTYDHWEITGYGTSDITNSYWTGDYSWIHVDRDGGPTFTWEDWSPRSDVNGNCGSYTLSVSALGFGIGHGSSVCETWLLTKYAAAGEIKVQWNGDSQGARDVALMSGIKVPNGASSPVWGISWQLKPRCISKLCPM